VTAESTPVWHDHIRINGRYRCVLDPADSTTDANAAEGMGYQDDPLDDIPALIAEVRRLRAERDAVLALHQKASPASYFCRCNHQWPCRTAQALGVTP
jgi:hypothetical protein